MRHLRGCRGRNRSTHPVEQGVVTPSQIIAISEDGSRIVLSVAARARCRVRPTVSAGGRHPLPSQREHRRSRLGRGPGIGFRLAERRMSSDGATLLFRSSAAFLNPLMAAITAGTQIYRYDDQDRSADLPLLSTGRSRPPGTVTGRSRGQSRSPGQIDDCGRCLRHPDAAGRRRSEHRRARARPAGRHRRLRVARRALLPGLRRPHAIRAGPAEAPGGRRDHPRGRDIFFIAPRPVHPRRPRRLQPPLRRPDRRRLRIPRRRPALSAGGLPGHAQGRARRTGARAPATFAGPGNAKPAQGRATSEGARPDALRHKPATSTPNARQPSQPQPEGRTMKLRRSTATRLACALASLGLLGVARRRRRRSGSSTCTTTRPTSPRRRRASTGSTSRNVGDTDSSGRSR